MGGHDGDLPADGLHDLVRRALAAAPGPAEDRHDRARALWRDLEAARRLVAAELSGDAPPARGPAVARRRAPSIRDVAAAAGVSHQTVSRVINDAPRVKPETRDLVTATIAAMGFRPNRTAQALGSGRAATVTVVSSETVLYGPAATIRGVEQAARRARRSVGIRVLESAEPDDLEAALDDLADPSAGHVVVIAFDAVGQALLARLPGDIPAVGALEPGARVPPGRLGLALDERTAARTATEHLLGLGHATVHHLAVPSEEPDRGRQAGWHDALVAAGREVPEPVPTGWSAVDGRDATARLLGAGVVPTAILCGNDDVAAGAVRALHDRGLAVPADVSLVGFDDVPAAAVAVPALTTVAMDFEALGRALTTAVLGEAVAAPDLPVPRLVVRESTAPPRT